MKRLHPKSAIMFLLLALPVPVLAQPASQAPKADWQPAAETSLPADPSTTTSLRPLQDAPAPENSGVPVLIDESEELLSIDRTFADTLLKQGPLAAYEAVLSAEGVLHDASGSSPAGPDGAKARFASFPADVTLERTPESAMAAGGSGSSWGRYVIRRGDTGLSIGRYVTVWRREPAGWRMVTELAAGRASTPPVNATGPLPRKPPSITPRTPPSNKSAPLIPSN